MNRSGFLCVFANDWGKTVLSFELELVYVSARAVEASVRRRMTLRSSSPGISSVHSSNNDNTSMNPSCGINTNTSTTSKGSSSTRGASSSSNSRDQHDRILGIKMKRIRGDSFMYTSLCRTILESADVRLDI
ncbi:unnamed protein product [Trichobilharzia regenti]|nr:unnamed protein product [Trichobilharzia regenti]